jgi:hypothetical protein
MWQRTKSGRQVGPRACYARLLRASNSPCRARAWSPNGSTDEERRRWVFIEDDLAEFVRSLYAVKKQALRVKNSDSESADRTSGSSASLRTLKEYDE